MTIFIISFNRYTMLKSLMDRLIEMKIYQRIVILDNKSDYPPLLQYYQEIKNKFEIIYLPMNYRHGVLRNLYNDEFCRKYNLHSEHYIYTDCDIVPVKECPPDFIQKFCKILEKYPHIEKVGFSIKIDDLPDSYEGKERIIKWESGHWGGRVFDEKIGIELFSAPIDTTFAMRRAGTFPGWSPGTSTFRTGAPYTSRHLPWYIETLSDEDKYYIQTAGSETHFPHGNQ